MKKAKRCCVIGRGAIFAKPAERIQPQRGHLPAMAETPLAFGACGKGTDTQTAGGNSAGRSFDLLLQIVKQRRIE